jgi:hypothetical protein
MRFHNGDLSSALPLVFIMCLSCPAQAASPELPVTVKGAVAACAYYPGDCTDASGKREASGAVDLPLGPIENADDPRARATIQSSLSASYGFLEVEGIATAWSQPRTQPGDEYARGIANGTLTWEDRLTVVSDTLPAGAPVRMKAHLQWRYENRTRGGHFQADTSVSAGNRFSLSADEQDGQASPVIFKSAEFAAVVGESIALQGHMKFVAQAIAGGSRAHELRFRAYGEVRFETLTPGVTFRATSGAAYR